MLKVIQEIYWKAYCKYQVGKLNKAMGEWRKHNRLYEVIDKDCERLRNEMVSNLKVTVNTAAFRCTECGDNHPWYECYEYGDY